MFEKIENKWTEDSGDYDDMIQKQLNNKRRKKPSSFSQTEAMYINRTYI